MALNTGVFFVQWNDKSEVKLTVPWYVDYFVNHSVNCTLISLIVEDEPDAVNSDLQLLIMSQKSRRYSFNKQADQPVVLIVLNSLIQHLRPVSHL